MILFHSRVQQVGYWSNLRCLIKTLFNKILAPRYPNKNIWRGKDLLSSLRKVGDRSKAILNIDRTLKIITDYWLGRKDRAHCMLLDYLHRKKDEPFKHYEKGRVKAI